MGQGRSAKGQQAGEAADFAGSKVRPKCFQDWDGAEEQDEDRGFAASHEVERLREEAYRLEKDLSGLKRRLEETCEE